MSVDPNRIIIFDTTLRDGEQSAGAAMTVAEKLRVALLLEDMQVDVIEAGFPISSAGDFEAVSQIAAQIKQTTVCALSRAVAKDIERAGEALKGAVRPRIHTFIGTSPLHRKHITNMDQAQMLDTIRSSVTLARSLCDDVEWSAMDATRTEREFLARAVETAIAAGATTVNIPDTVGYAIPDEFGALIAYLLAQVPNIDRAVLSVHCQNDLGLATANSLAAVQAGARQVECTINGLGERAGNASLEEIVMAIRTRADIFPVETRIVTEEIVPASRLVSGITGFPVQPNKAIVGANAFAHEAGIHQDGILKHRETYEIMRAQDVGWSNNRLVLGKHSGRAAVKARFEELGVRFESPEEMESAFQRFKELADKKHEIFDEDLQSIAGNVSSGAAEERFRLVALEAISHTGEKPRATVVLSVDGHEKSSFSEGDGPVDAVFRAIEQEAASGAKLLLFSINAITTGTDSQAEVMVRLERDGRIVNGAGADTDIIVASAKSYLDALNTLGAAPREHPQISGI
jgi:2-isopropylmalate synthase